MAQSASEKTSPPLFTAKTVHVRANRTSTSCYHAWSPHATGNDYDQKGINSVSVMGLLLVLFVFTVSIYTVEMRGNSWRYISSSIR
jgi:hypothetical protein